MLRRPEGSCAYPEASRSEPGGPVPLVLPVLSDVARTEPRRSDGPIYPEALERPASHVAGQECKLDLGANGQLASLLLLPTGDCLLVRWGGRGGQCGRNRFVEIFHRERLEKHLGETLAG